MEIKVRRKYMVGKIQGNPTKARTNNKTPSSIGKSLFAQWLEITANREIHKTLKAKLAKKDVPLISRKGGVVTGAITRKRLQELWAKK